MYKKSIPFVLLLLGIIALSLGQAEGYELGQGWHGGNYHLSGYANLEIVDRFDAPSKLDLDDLSLFAGGRINQGINPFMEAELSKHTLYRQGGGAQHGDVIVERFYDDVILSEQDTLRIGKELTPLGDWNLIHASPLVPLVTRPYSTGETFAAYMSGVSWQHDTGNGSVQLYWQPDTEWFHRPPSQTSRNFRDVYGGHVNLPFGLIDKFGVSFQDGQLIETGEDYSLIGFNIDKTFGSLRIESEAISGRFTGTVSPGTRWHDREGGFFVLADYAITPQLHGILEGEHFQDHLVDRPSRSTSVALNYKPGIATMLKLEYIHQAGVSASFAPIQTGLKASFSFLF